MDIFKLALLIGALGTVAIAYNLPRAPMWVMFATVNFIAGSLYHYSGLPHHPAFVLCSDVVMCLLIDWKAKEVWELRAFNVFQLSVLISILKLFGVVDELYVVSLELCNWLFLLVIGGTALLSGMRANGNSIWPSWRRLFSGPYDYLRSPRNADHWSKVR